MIIATNTATIIIFHLYAPQNNSKSNSSKYRQVGVSLFSNPLILTSIVAITFNYCGIQTNIGIKKFLKILGEASLPLGIMNVGAALKFDVQNLSIRNIVVASISKLVLLPLVTLVVLWAFGVGGVLKSIAILHSSLPTATSAYILSRRLGGDPNSMASIITSTTVLSVISLTFIMYMIT
jgi:predicted permease